jgi:transcription antitermination factor NusG
MHDIQTERSRTDSIVGPESAYPESALTAAASQWFALTVCPRHEKQAAQILDAKQVVYCLPLYASLRYWKDRRKQVEMVLFPGYVFVNIALRDRLAVLTVPGVVGFVSFQGRPAVVPDHEISAIRVGSSSGCDVQPHPYLKKGQRVRVKAGPLVDTEGILVRRKGHFRMVISVNSLMRSLSVQVDECDIAPL